MIPKNLLSALLLLCALSSGLLSTYAQERVSANTQTAPAASRGPQKFSKDGVEVEFTIEPVVAVGQAKAELLEMQDAVVRFRLRDTATKVPLAGVKPSAWMSRREQATATSPQECREKISSYLQGSLRSRPDVDLNAYYILALNREANISVIDPLLGFGGSKLLTLVQLKSPGEDWAQTRDRKTIFVSLPLVNQVGVVDASTWKVVANIDAGAKPTRLALQPDEKYLWVGDEAAGAESGLTVIDAATLKVAAHIKAGAGQHEFAFSDDGRLAFVSNSADGTLTIFDVAKLAKINDVKTGASVAAIAFSPLSKAVYAVDDKDGQIAVIDSRSLKITAHVQAQPGVKSLRFTPDGRYGFAPNPSANVVHIFDAISNRLLHSAPAGKAPDQITFTGAYAYVHSSGTEEVSLIRLDSIGKDLSINNFPGGQNAPASARTVLSVADSIVPAPEGNSVLVANAADKMMYYYTEGMAAPMASFQNYGREPRALMIVDNSLRETSAGVYTTTTRLPASGVYDVAFLLDSPRIINCFEADAKADHTIKHEHEAALRIEYLDRDKPLRVGEEYKLRFRLFDAATNQAKDGLQDVRVLIFLAPGIWQKRDFAKSVGDGVYEVNESVPQKGVYMIFVGSQSQGVAFRQLPSLTLQAKEAAVPAKP